MTDREEFEKWAKHHDVNTMRMTISNAYMSNGAYLAWASWQARGELDAVRIKELEAKLDKAREALKWSLATIDVSDWEDDIYMSEACGKYAWATHVHRGLYK